MLHVGTPDTDPGIVNANADGSTRLAIHARRDTAAFGKLNRVVDEIAQRLSQTVFVDDYHGFLIFDCEHQGQVFSQCLRLDLVEHPANQWDQCDRPRLYRERTRFKLRIILHGVERSEEAIAGARHRLKAILLTRVLNFGEVFGDQIAVTEDNVERSAKFMADVGEECGLEARRLNRHVALALKFPLPGPATGDIANDAREA